MVVLVLCLLAMLLGAAFPVSVVTARTVNPDSPQTDTPDSAFVEVPTYSQQRNLSCEYASLVMAMAAYGTWISEWTFDEMVPLSDNPHWGYRGDINGDWGNTIDYGVYPEPLVGPLAQLGFRGQVLYAQGDAGPLKRYLANGVPVVVWLGMKGDQAYYEYASDGTPYKVNPGYHVVVAYGFDESGVYAADPATGGTVSWLWTDFMWMWDAMDGMSLAVWPVPTHPTELETEIVPEVAPEAVSEPNDGICC
jgi:uncharacterized protein YvpB